MPIVSILLFMRLASSSICTKLSADKFFCELLKSLERNLSMAAFRAMFKIQVKKRPLLSL